jgi:ABC-type uncharacterized transport system substrate-binding protein
MELLCGFRASSVVPRCHWGIVLLCSCLVLFCMFGCSPPEEADSSEHDQQNTAGQKELPTRSPRILLVNSYHYQYPWTRGITQAAAKVLQVELDSLGMPLAQKKTSVTFQVVYLDTKRNTSQSYIRQRVEWAKEHIDQFAPDVLLVSDDNAVNYLVAPHCREWGFPVIFCGVNWSADEYHLPQDQVIGMVEVQLIDQLVEQLLKYSRGKRIGYLKGDDFAARKEAKFYTDRFNLNLQSRFIQTYAQWEQEYRRLQHDVDLLLIGNAASIKGWDAQRARELVMSATTIPTGNWDSWMAPYAMLTLATKPEEQGEWIAQRALDILAGTSITELHSTRNKQAAVYLNMALAKKLGITLPVDLVLQAELVQE